jgi:hypothetical protein
MSILPVQLLTPASQIGKAAGSAVAAVGSGFAGLLKTALRAADTTSLESATNGNAQATPAGSATPVGGASGAADLTAFRKETDDLLKSLHRKIIEMLSSNGVDVSGGVHLRMDDFGQVRVDGNHPNKHDIEGLLASHPELEDAFREVAARSAAARQFDQSKLGASLDVALEQVDLYLDLGRTEITFTPAANT